MARQIVSSSAVLFVLYDPSRRARPRRAISWALSVSVARWKTCG